MNMGKVRLDALIYERGMAESRERAKAIVMSGNVYIGGSKAEKPGMQVDADTLFDIRGGLEYVSRGGKKLEKALSRFGIHIAGRTCIDCGASTGGFTDCLLKNGAGLVYAVDVGYGQLAWSIRNDSRVVVMERTNIRNVTPDMLDIKPELAVIDLSFISLALVLPVVGQLMAEDFDMICLIKPQFEAGREKVGKKGVVRDADTHINVLKSFERSAAQAELNIRGLTHSPVKGPEGNIEFLGWLGRIGSNNIDIGAAVADAHNDLNN